MAALPQCDSVTLDISDGITLMDGLRAHEVNNYTGERYSIIFFTRKGWEKADQKELNALEDCFFPIPTAKSEKAIDSWLCPPNDGRGPTFQKWISEYDGKEDTERKTNDIFPRGIYRMVARTWDRKISMAKHRTTRRKLTVPTRQRPLGSIPK